MKNELCPCTHRVPKNRFGIIAMHCIDNQPFSPADLQRILDGPIAAAEPRLLTELAKPLDLKTLEGGQ